MKDKYRNNSNCFYNRIFNFYWIIVFLKSNLVNELDI